MHSRKFVVTGATPINNLKKYSISDRGVLDKRIKANPRYTGIRSRTNTGFNTHRRKELEQEIRKYYKVKNDEVFRRISLADLLQLMVAYAEDSKALDNDVLVHEEEKNEAEVPIKFRDEVESVVHQMDQLEVEERVTASECPYILIDVRPSTDFKESHFATAVNHPYSRMSRAVSWECAEMLIYKNHSEYIIVVYDEAEDLAPEVAATLQHRGYANVFMLSGGLRLAKDKFGFPLVTDDLSPSLTPQVVAAISQQMMGTVLPPLSMTDASDWWAAASKAPSTSAPTDSGITKSVSTATTDRQTVRSQLKNRDGQPVKPWR